MAAISPSAPPAPVNPTGQIAQQLPSYDPGPVITAQEQSLQDYLNLPVQEILARLGMSPFAERPHENEARPPEEQPPPDPQGQGTPFDPMSLISPVTDALGTLGTGLFEGVDPTQMLAGVSNAFQSTANPLQQAVGSLDQSWLGASGTAAGAKTAEAIVNGAEVGAQSDALRTSLATAATNVAQARARLVEIIAEFNATMAAIGPNIIFPWGWAAAIAAANKAIASTAEVMTELQSSLGAQAAQVTAAGAPVDVTSAPLAGSSPMASLLSPLMSMATKGAQAGIQAGTQAASAAGKAASESAAQTTDAATAPIAGGAARVPPVGAGTGGGGGGGAAFGGGGTLASRSIAASPIVQPESGPASGQTAAMRAPGSSGGGAGMMGAPYAPMAGHGANASSNNTHAAASFLHTTDQGGEIIGDLGTAAPPVLGEADPNEPPDVELRI
jgi:hypothetical protein